MISMFLVILLIFGGLEGYTYTGSAFAAGTVVLDQEQSLGYGNAWVNQDYPRYQTFMPAISGKLDKIDINVAGVYTSGAIKVSLYREGDLSAPLATGQSVSSFGSGWVAVDFSGTSPYLKKDTTYRMVVSSENGGSNGFGWYMSTGNVYPRGSSQVAGYDFSFRTYMDLGSLLMDQEQSGGGQGDVWLNRDAAKYQTFTPAITGNLGEIALYLSEAYSTPGAIILQLYEDSNPSTPLAEVRSNPMDTAGWVVFDFAGKWPYLQNDTMYRMVVSTENGNDAGLYWYAETGDVYDRGYSTVAGMDFTFRTFSLRIIRRP